MQHATARAGTQWQVCEIYVLLRNRGPCAPGLWPRIIRAPRGADSPVRVSVAGEIPGSGVRAALLDKPDEPSMPTPNDSPLAPDCGVLLSASRVHAIACLDAAALSGLRELDPQGRNGLIGRVVKGFQDSLARLVPQLRSAMQANDNHAIRYVSHTLKSSSASIGALRLSSLCAEIEAAVRSGQTEGLQQRVDAVCAEIESVKPALDQLALTS